MKKILALVLALVMTMSLATISSGAAFSDADSVQYTDAVNTLTALGVVNGRTDGSFGPQADVTRGAAAKMVAMVATGSNTTTLGYYAGTSSFADVPATHTFSDAVAFCVGKGIVDGYGDGTYGVGDNVKGWAIAKMVLVAMGYDAEAFGLTGAGAALRTIDLATKCGLFAGMKSDFVATAAASREECAQIVYNALTEGLMVEGGMINGVPTYSKSSTACLMQNYVSGAAVDSAAIASLTVNTLTDNVAMGNAYGNTVAGDTLTNETGLELVGHKVGYVDTKAPLVYGAKTAYAVVDLSTVVTVDTAISTQKAFEAAFGTELVDSTYDVYTNYTKTGTATMDVSTYTAAAGTYVVYNNAVVSYMINDFKVGYVSAYTAGTSKTDGTLTVAGPAAESWTLETSDASKAAFETTKVSFYSDIAVGDIVVVQPTGLLDTVTKAATVSGVATAVANYYSVAPSITVGGVVYPKSSDFVTSGLGLTLKGDLASSMLNADVTLYLDPNGAVFAVIDTPDATNDAGLAYVVKTWTKETAGVYGEASTYEYFVQAVDMTGAVVDYQTESDFGGAVAGDLMAVTTSYSNTVKATVADFAASSAAGSKIVDDNDSDITAYALKVASTSDYFASDVKFIYVSGSGSTLKVEVKDGVQAVTTDNLDYYAVQVGTSSNYDVKYVVVPAAYTAGVVSSTDVVYANEAMNSTEAESYTDVNGDAQKAFAHYVYINGVYTKVLTSTATKITGWKSYTIDANGLYTFSTLSENVGSGVVSNLYGTLLTVGSYADVEAKNAKIVDTVYAAMTDAEKAAAEEITTLAQLDGATVAVVYNMDATKTYATDFVTIYVTGYAVP